MVHCETQKEVDTYWDKLTSGGGEESMCGWLKDKYGISWQIIPNALLRLQADKDRAKANRVMQAMLKMRKIDIPTLERAAAG
jgi:predicted 3-demethylubiquinone-9 3-methyltransferase (glyoxalase superfamily)